MGIALKIGDKAPLFKLADQNGKLVSLKDFAGRKLLVYFYPKASTPGCTTQSCAVSESLASLKGAGVEAVGISPDDSAAQLKFDKKYNLGFPLLADTEHKVSEAYGVWGEKSMYGKKYMGIIRSAFLIDERGKLLAVAYKVSPAETVPIAWKALEG
jgi:thioredoxin-dependent peroxiredoxin